LDRERSRQSPNYEIVAQSAEEMQDTQNAPAVSKGPYLIESGQTRLLTTISIYSQRGENREQIRLLYMNAVALRVWKAMGKRPRLIGAHRPPRNALLTFGVMVDRACDAQSPFVKLPLADAANSALVE